MATVGAWPVPWAQYASRGGVAGPLGPTWSPRGRGRSLSPVCPPWRRCRFPGERMAAVGAWPVFWPHMAVVGVSPVPLAPYARREGVAIFLGPVWPPRGCGRSLCPYGRRGGVAGPLSPVCPPWGRGRSPGPRKAPVGAWPVPWAQHGRRGGVAGPLDPCGPRGGVVGPLGPVGPRGVWPVPWAPYGCHGGHAGLLGPVRPLWGRGRSPGPRLAAVGAWPVPWARGWSPGLY